MSKVRMGFVRLVCVLLCGLLAMAGFAGAEGGAYDGYEVAVVRVPEGEKAAPLTDGSFEAAQSGVSGDLLDGALVEIVGEDVGGFCRVKAGNAFGTMESKYLERTGERSTADGIVPRGYAVITTTDADAANLRAFPGDDNYRNENSADPGNILTGRTMLLYSVAGGYAQIGLYAYQGFVPEDAVAVYWFDDLFAEERKDIPDGSHVAGKDFTPGLYTFTIAEDGQGTLASSVNGMERTYEAKGAAEFTVYLPGGAEITVAGGAMRPAERQDPFASDGRAEYAGNGKLLTYLGGVGSTHMVTVPEGGEGGRYRLVNLLFEEGKAEPREEGELAPGEEHVFLVFPGEIVEIENCVLVPQFGNG